MLRVWQKKSNRESSLDHAAFHALRIRYDEKGTRRGELCLVGRKVAHLGSSPWWPLACRVKRCLTLCVLESCRKESREDPFENEKRARRATTSHFYIVKDAPMYILSLVLQSLSYLQP